MASSGRVLAGYARWARARGRRSPCCVPLLLAALWGCSTQPVDQRAINALAPLQLEQHSLTVAAVEQRVSTPDLLALDQSMREFVARYKAAGNSRVRLVSLHSAVRGSGSLDLQYDPFADGTAQQVFHRGSANCLAYANLFIALAREAGLDARYQWLEVRPQWSRVGERVQVGLHVNVVVRLRDGSRFMVDIDPLPARDIAGSRALSDRDGQALYHNNIAMDALANADLERAWLHTVRALQLSPGIAYLWVNLGAIYRAAGQHRAAEQSYLQALQLDGQEYSAMTNLAVLYGIEGRREEQAHWLARAARHRQHNPYYHASLGDSAGAAGDWPAALAHYDRAVALAPGDSHLLFALGLIQFQLQDLDGAASNMQKAIEQATLHSDIETYQQQLEEVRRAALAGL